MTTRDTNDQRLWEELCAAEDAFYRARMALHRDAVDLSSVLAAGLASKPLTALRFLAEQPEQEIRKHMAALVELASVGTSITNIALARSALQKIERTWLVEHIDLIASPLLAAGDEWEFRRIAELYALLDAGLLRRHLQRCAAHVDEEIRVIASEFADAAS